MPSLLQQGIRLLDYRGKESSVNARVSLSYGTLEVSGSTGLRMAFCSDAFVPKEPWRDLSLDEQEMICANDAPSRPGSWVSLVSIPAEILAPFESLRMAARALAPAEVLDEIKSSPESRQGMSRFLDYIEQIGIAEKRSIEGKGIADAQPGFPTTAFSQRSDCYAGLHIDSWYAAPVENRHLSPTRLSLNLGPEDRYLVFINLEVQSIASALASLDPAASKAPGHRMATAFMREFPDYPVVKVRIGQGEAYIAPTENCIHDGSTLGKEFLDITLTMRGRFSAIAAGSAGSI